MAEVDAPLLGHEQGTLGRVASAHARIEQEGPAEERRQERDAGEDVEQGRQAPGEALAELHDGAGRGPRRAREQREAAPHDDQELDRLAQRLGRVFDPGQKPGVAVEGFCAVQLSDYSDAFDWERSQYDRDEVLPERVSYLDRLVLKDVPLPPLFRLAARPRALMVSAAGREALEAEHVRGITYLPLRQVI